MKKSVWVVLVIVTLLLAACGPAMQPATSAETPNGEKFVVALPRLQVDFDSEGNPSVAGVNLADVAKFTGADLSNMKLNKFYIDWMTNANVQNVELRQTGNGVALYVNGKPLPNIAWSDASLQAASDLAGVMGVQNTSMLAKFLPIVRRLGLDMVLTFPKAEGAAAIPLADPNTVVNTAAKASGEPASAQVQFEVKYDENGVPAILGISAADLAAMGINAPLALDPSYLKMLKDNNIQTLELRGKGDGLFVYVNGQPLPNIAWDDTFLKNTADLYAQMNPQSPYISAVQTLVPMINKADLGVLIHFPVAEGQKPIAATMH